MNKFDKLVEAGKYLKDKQFQSHSGTDTDSSLNRFTHNLYELSL